MNGFTIYSEYFDLITLLPKNEQGELLLAICNYMIFDEKPTLNEAQIKIFRNLKRPLDKSKKRSINSSKNETKQKRNENEMKTKRKRNENERKTHQDVNVIVNVNDNLEKKDNRGMGEEEKKETFSEKIHFAEFVTMTNAEYEKLVSTYSKKFADQCIKTLDNYKGSSGKKYRSDYRAILSWGVDKVKKDVSKDVVPEWFNEEQDVENVGNNNLDELDKILEEIGVTNETKEEN